VNSGARNSDPVDSHRANNAASGPTPAARREPATSLSSNPIDSDRADNAAHDATPVARRDPATSFSSDPIDDDRANSAAHGATPVAQHGAGAADTPSSGSVHSGARLVLPASRSADFARVSFDRVCYDYGRRRVLSRVSFTCAAGAMTGLLGPNGAGKSTLLAIAATRARASLGEVHYGALRASRADWPLRAQIGWLGHDPGFYPELTARENLVFYARLHGAPRAEIDSRVERALDHAGLAARADDAVGGFSRGMRQRLGLERALLHRPRLVLLDEPFTGLDDASAAALVDRLRDLRSLGAIILLSTHDLDLVANLLDRVLVLRAGRIVDEFEAAPVAAPAADVPAAAAARTNAVGLQEQGSPDERLRDRYRRALAQHAEPARAVEDPAFDRDTRAAARTATTSALRDDARGAGVTYTSRPLAAGSAPAAGTGANLDAGLDAILDTHREESVGALVRRFTGAAWLIMRKDLMVEFRSRELFLTTLFFAVSCVLVFAFALVRDGRPMEDAAAGILWIAVSFSGTLALGRTFEREQAHHTLPALLQAPVERAAVYVGKLLGLLVLLLLVGAIVVPLVALFFQATLLAMGGIVAVMVLAGTVGFLAVGTLFSAMLVRTRSRDVLLPVLLYPMTIPVMLAGVRGTSALIQETPDLAALRMWLAMLVLFDAVFLTLALWTFDAVTSE
jgi:heme exporter protein CcmB